MSGEAAPKRKRSEKRQRTVFLPVRLTPAELERLVEIAGSRRAVPALLRNAGLAAPECSRPEQQRQESGR